MSRMHRPSAPPAPPRAARLVAWSAVCAAAAVVAGCGDDAADGDRGASGTTTVAVAPPTTYEGTGLSAAAGRRAMRLLRDDLRPGEGVMTLSILSSGLSAQIGGPGTAQRALSVPATGPAVRGPLDVDGGNPRTGRDGLDPEAPGRIVAAIRRALPPGTPAAITSMMLSGGRQPAWSVLLERTATTDQRWSADGPGRAVVRAEDGAPAPLPGQQGNVRVPTGLDDRSLLRRANLRVALRSVGAAAGPGARVTSMLLSPKELTVGVRAGGKGRTYFVDAALGLRTGSTERPENRGVALADLDPGGPERALRAIAKQFRTEPGAGVDDVLLRRPKGERRFGYVLYVKVPGDAPGERRSLYATLDGKPAE